MIMTSRGRASKTRRDFYRAQTNWGRKDLGTIGGKRVFAEGIEEVGRHSPIDQRTLPTIGGLGLTEEENRRVNGARNRARAAYAAMAPEASEADLDRVARLAATDELRRTLALRPAAQELVVEVVVAPVMAPVAVVSPVVAAPSVVPAKPATRRTASHYEPTEADWADYRAWKEEIDRRHQETRLSPEEEDTRFIVLDLHRGVAWEQETNPFDLALTTMAAVDYFGGLEEPEPELLLSGCWGGVPAEVG